MVSTPTYQQETSSISFKRACLCGPGPSPTLEHGQLVPSFKQLGVSVCLSVFGADGEGKGMPLSMAQVFPNIRSNGCSLG